MIKSAILSYPMLFQTQGGLQIQILESINALRKIGIDARLVNPNVEKLTDFDLVHVFAAINGNHRIIGCAKSLGLPTVCSPLIQPHWNQKLGRRARFLERLVGRLTEWEVKTEYQQIDSCLHNADLLLALGDIERDSIINAFGIDGEKVRIVPNGIPARFFLSSKEAAQQNIENDAPFLLCAATINPHKNQLSLARATANTGYRLVLIGQCLPADQGYLDQILAFPHVSYVGKLDYEDPLLASFYAAAGVFCLVSHSEVMPLCVLEALAAGTPVVMTQNHCMDVSKFGDVLLEVAPRDESKIEHALRQMISRNNLSDRCREAVKHFSWDATAKLIHDAYVDVLNK